MKFSFPSIDQITEAVARVGKRFPLVVLVSLVGTIVAIWLADLSFASQEEYPRLLAVCFVSGLGISFFYAIATFLEQKEWSIAIKGTVNALGLILLAIYYLLLGDQLWEGPSELFYRFFLFALVSHLLVAFAPFFHSGKLDQFWEYNKTLFLRILLSVLYSGVLFIGLSIALLAIDNLLGLDIDGETYFQLFLFLGGIFNTWFFLAGVPEKNEIQNKSIIFHTGLRVFVQYVLIPLVSVYIFILYLYLGKIILQWELPNGWVANLVLSFSIAGILSLLLLYPIRNSKEFKWVSFYSKYYYLLLIPLIGLLMFSIWVRISEYGVTINRYFVATLGVWLTGIVIYFIVSKTKSIKVIPISLCIITLTVSFGPFGAFAVSERSQLKRFEKVLDKNEMLDENNQIIPKKEGDEVTFEDRKELSSSIDYLVDNHGIGHFKSYFETFNDSEQHTQDIFELMNLEYINRWQIINSDTLSGLSYYFTIETPIVFDVSEYDILLSRKGFSLTSDSLILNHKGLEWEIDYDFLQDVFSIREKIGNKELKVALKELALSVKKAKIEINGASNISQELMILEEENEDIKIAIIFISLSGQFLEETLLKDFTADIFIKIKK
ncbi:MAG: DUF4153 domain-containing protein [Balneolaceae bacterium]